MKRKTVIALSILTTVICLCGCNSAESVGNMEVTMVETETTETEMQEVESEPQETETQSLPDNTSEATTSTETTRTDYPDSNPEHQKAWDNFCNNWNESDYGTTTKGKVMNDFPYYGDTGYDPKGTILQYRTTDKGYTVFYDTATGRVYYTGMTLPTGDGWIERESGSAAVITQYIIDNNLTGIYDITYAEFQELLGTYAGD